MRRPIPAQLPAACTAAVFIGAWAVSLDAHQAVPLITSLPVSGLATGRTQANTAASGPCLKLVSASPPRRPALTRVAPGNGGISGACLGTAALAGRAWREEASLRALDAMVRTGFPRRDTRKAPQRNDHVFRAGGQQDGDNLWFLPPSRRRRRSGLTAGFVCLALSPACRSGTWSPRNGDH